MLLATMFFAVLPVALAKATTVTTNIKVPVEILVFIPCALGGTGEVVELSGNLHLLTHVTTDNNGGMHVEMHAQPQGISGIGMDSGDKYQATGVTRGHINTQGPAPFESTFVNNFRIIVQGRGNNFLVHQVIHVTINANGDVTADIDKMSVDCK